MTYPLIGFQVAKLQGDAGSRALKIIVDGADEGNIEAYILDYCLRAGFPQPELVHVIRDEGLGARANITRMGLTESIQCVTSPVELNANSYDAAFGHLIYGCMGEDMSQTSEFIVEIATLLRKGGVFVTTSNNVNAGAANYSSYSLWPEAYSGAGKTIAEGIPFSFQMAGCDDVYVNMALSPYRTDGAGKKTPGMMTTFMTVAGLTLGRTYLIKDRLSPAFPERQATGYPFVMAVYRK